MRGEVFLSIMLVAVCTNVEATKVIARKITYIDQYSLRSDEVLCSGMAREAGKAYLPRATTLEPEAYCRATLKPRIVYPASSCDLEHMVGQCLDEANKHKVKRD